MIKRQSEERLRACRNISCERNTLSGPRPPTTREIQYLSRPRGEKHPPTNSPSVLTPCVILFSLPPWYRASGTSPPLITLSLSLSLSASPSLCYTHPRHSFDTRRGKLFEVTAVRVHRNLWSHKCRSSFMTVSRVTSVIYQRSFGALKLVTVFRIRASSSVPNCNSRYVSAVSCNVHHSELSSSYSPTIIRCDSLLSLLMRYLGISHDSPVTLAFHRIL